jgi:transposase
MAKSWKYVVPQLFPNAKIIIDHFHVISYLNQLIAKKYRIGKSTMSKAEQNKKLLYKMKGFGVVLKLYEGGKYWKAQDEEKIRQVFEAFPRVAELWYWKEEVRRIYFECRDKYEARERWQIVLKNLNELPRTTLTEHLKNILNYFDKRSTNAVTEGYHTKFKLIKRYSYGL